MKKSIFTIIKEIFNKSIRSQEYLYKSIKYEYDTPSIAFSKDLDKNISLLKSYLGNSDDISFRYFEISTTPSIRAAVIFIETLIDDKLLESSVLTPLTYGLFEKPIEKDYMYDHMSELIERILSNSNISFVNHVNKAIEEIQYGKGILLVHNNSKAISVSIAKAALREHAEPQTEKVINGPQQGFVEDINVNIYMIRRRIKSSNLVVKNLFIGRESKSEIRIVYIKNIADSSIVEELFKRLKRIDVDGIFGQSNIEEYISDAPINLFQTTFYTERPDRVQAMLLEGRIAILCDSSPFIMIIPSIVSDFFISSNDYYQNTYFATFDRLIGYLGAFILTYLPSVYIAITTFHHEVLPTRLALTIAGARAGVPFPAFLEAIAMEIAFSALRLAGTRLPTHIGQAVSIVGALIIGQAAVEAGLVSSTVVIVVATTAIFSFTIPYTNFSSSLRLVRFFMMTLAATLGIYGIMTGTLIIALNLISLRSFGVPFMVPFAPLSLSDFKDWVMRFPQWSITKRSSHIVKRNITKKSTELKPKPIKNERSR